MRINTIGTYILHILVVTCSSFYNERMIKIRNKRHCITVHAFIQAYCAPAPLTILSFVFMMIESLKKYI